MVYVAVPDCGYSLLYPLNVTGLMGHLKSSQITDKRNNFHIGVGVSAAFVEIDTNHVADSDSTHNRLAVRQHSDKQRCSWEAYIYIRSCGAMIRSDHYIKLL